MDNTGKMALADGAMLIFGTAMSDNGAGDVQWF